MSELRLPDPAALAVAATAFDRRGTPFRPEDLRALPGDDERLDPRYREALVRYYSSSLLGERAAAAFAGAAARAGPPTLERGFEAQAADEERHASLDETRLAQLGADPAAARTVVPSVAREMDASLGFDDPMRRLFLTNVVGETALAASVFPAVIALALANGDARSAALERARLADEVRHVRFATKVFEILVVADPANGAVLQRWQDEHFTSDAGAFLTEVVPALERAPGWQPGPWLDEALEAYRRRARGLGLRPP